MRLKDFVIGVLENGDKTNVMVQHLFYKLNQMETWSPVMVAKKLESLRRCIDKMAKAGYIKKDFIEYRGRAKVTMLSI